MVSKRGKRKLGSIDLGDIFLPKCEPGKCRTNCRKNPNCFNHLGEKFWIGPIQESYWIQCENPEDFLRQKDCPVGLRNLGATCYMNAFLQLWFHNKSFVSGIYRWRPQVQYDGWYSSSEDWIRQHPPSAVLKDHEPLQKESNLPCGEVSSAIPHVPNEVLPEFLSQSSDAICLSLQYLFAKLQGSSRRCIDPSPIVRSLGLQANQQQDAQEFSKLFMSCLEDSLSRFDDPSVSNLVAEQFGGTYVYRTSCNSCNCVSDTSSNFYELDLSIQGHVQLVECLKDFLKEECLDGENKYYCAQCCAKTGATRKIVLLSLPPVLNLQLLRFVYDRQAGTKKKLNSAINFPETLDLSGFVGIGCTTDCTYKLTAVLIHQGLSAHSGHYVAHILDAQADKWCRFSDDDVTVLKSKKRLDLSADDDLDSLAAICGEAGKPAAHSRKAGFHSSKNAYMLVYSRSSIEYADSGASPPDYIQRFVDADNLLFDDWMKNMQLIRAGMVSKGEAKVAEVLEFLPDLPAKPEDSGFEWIATEWLKTWLNPNTGTVSPICHTSLICQHGKMDPSKISLAKRASLKAAEYFYRTFGGGPRLKGDDVCITCLERISRKSEFERSVLLHQNTIDTALKPSYKCAAGYWVGKGSLKRWKSAATSSYSMLESQIDCEASKKACREVCEDSDSSPKADDEQAGRIFENCLEDSSTGLSQIFNADVVCAHGNLCSDVSSRKLVSEEIWLALKSFFPSAVEYTDEAAACEMCAQIANEELRRKVEHKSLLQERKQILSFLLAEPTVRSAELLGQDEFSLVVVSNAFVSAWRRFLRTGSHPTSADLETSDFLCVHRLLLYSAEELLAEVLKVDGRISLLKVDQYSKLADGCSSFQQVSISKRVITVGGQIERAEYSVHPELCTVCRQMRLEEEAKEAASYRDAPLYVVYTSRAVASRDSLVTGDAAGDALTEGEVHINGGANNAFAEHNGVSHSCALQGTQIKNDKDHPFAPRKSSRHRAKPGEFVIRVDSDQTLKQLKVRLLQHFAVLPCDQHLILSDGRQLVGDDCTLLKLAVKPGSRLILTVDESAADGVASEAGAEIARMPEEGFKGTGLLGTKSC